MALETGTYISDLVATNPTGSDPLAFADDHLRLIKSTVKATFPNISGAVTKTHTEINNTLDKTGDTMTGVLTLSGDATADLHAVPRRQVVQLVQALYPVGSVYINATNATNPATLLGFGTWVAFGAGRVPVGFNAADPLFDTAEETGGSKDAIVVSHTHTYSGTTSTQPEVEIATGYTQSGGVGGYAVSFGVVSVESTASALPGLTSNVPAHSHTYSGTSDSSGVSGTNANLQPYITVYMWKRTA